MIRNKKLEQWETKLANTETTPQALWPIAKSLTNREGPRAPTVIHGLLGLKYHPVDKANAIADYLENHFTSHVQALLQAADNNPPAKMRPCDLQKLLN
jgi:hypothetical protein